MSSSMKFKKRYQSRRTLGLLCKCCCGYLIWFLVTLFFVLAGFLVYWGIIVYSVNRGTGIGMNTIAEMFSNQLEGILRTQFNSMENVLGRFDMQLSSHFNSENTTIRDLYRNAMRENPRLIRDLQVSTLASEEMVRGLGYIHDRSHGVISFVVRPGKTGTDPYFVVMSDPDSPNNLNIEEYNPESFSVKKLGTIPAMRSLLTRMLPNTFPTWTSDKDTAEFQTGFDLNYPFIARWNILPDSQGFSVSFSPLEVTHTILMRLTQIIPVSISIVETDTLRMLATDKEVLLSNITAMNYNSELKDYLERHPNLESSPENVEEVNDSYFVLRRLQTPYRWSMILNFSNYFSNIWKRYRNLLLALSFILALAVTLPLCCIYQSYIFTKDTVRRLKSSW